jgi:hypothetical protein
MTLRMITCSVVLLSPLAHADVILDAVPGALVPVEVEMTLQVPVFGSSTASDSTTTTLIDSSFAVQPSASFDMLDVNGHSLFMQGGQLQLDFFCSFLGCFETVTVSVDNLTLNLLTPPADVPIVNDAWALQSVRYGLELDFSYTGSLVGSGVSTTVAEDFITIDGAISQADGLLVMSNIGLQSLSISVTPDSLPSGVDSIDLTINADLGALVYSGLYETADIDGDGQVCGSDLALLLGNWGGTGTGDLDGDGLISGSDLALLLSAWNC